MYIDSAACTPTSRVNTESFILHMSYNEYLPAQTSSPITLAKMAQTSTSIPAQMPIEDPFWDPNLSASDVNQEEDESCTTESDTEHREQETAHNGYEDSSDDSQCTPTPRLHENCRRPKPRKNNDPAVVSLKTAADYEAYAMRRFHSGTQSAAHERRRDDRYLENDPDSHRRATSESTNQMIESLPLAHAGQGSIRSEDCDGLYDQVENLSLYTEPKKEEGCEADIDWSRLAWDEDWVMETHYED